MENDLKEQSKGYFLETFFGVLINYEILETWNIGVGYRKISSVGFYISQRTAINNFYINQHLKSKNHRYQLIFYGIYNESYNEENGGIQNDTLFTDSPEKISRKGLPVNFTEAINRSRQQEYLLKQRFNFGPSRRFYYRDAKDSLYPDSIIKTQIIPRITRYGPTSMVSTTRIQSL
jgi:hypothetical protein